MLICHIVNSKHGLAKWAKGTSCIPLAERTDISISFSCLHELVYDRVLNDCTDFADWRNATTSTIGFRVRGTVQNNLSKCVTANIHNVDKISYLSRQLCSSRRSKIKDVLSLFSLVVSHAPLWSQGGLEHSHDWGSILRKKYSFFSYVIVFICRCFIVKDWNSHTNTQWIVCVLCFPLLN